MKKYYNIHTGNLIGKIKLLLRLIIELVNLIDISGYNDVFLS